MDTGTKSAPSQQFSKSKQAPSSLQIYKDVNRALGIGFRIVFGWVGINVDKYTHATPGMKKVHKNAKKKRRGGLLSFIPG